MKKERFTKGAVVAELPPLADFGYIIPAHEIPTLAATSLAVPDTDAKRKGRRADTRVSYMDVWARRYWRSQAGVERDRLRKGKARHRAHRNELPLKSPDGDDS